jgi:hypothetical protein
LSAQLILFATMITPCLQIVTVAYSITDSLFDIWVLMSMLNSFDKVN